MRITLLIDVETDDIPRLQKYVGAEPAILLKAQDGWQTWGRFIGAKEAVQNVSESTSEGD